MYSLYTIDIHIVLLFDSLVLNSCNFFVHTVPSLTGIAGAWTLAVLSASPVMGHTHLKVSRFREATKRLVKFRT